MNHKIPLICIFLCAFLLSNASDSTKVKPYNRFYIGPSFTLDASYRILQETVKPSGNVVDPTNETIKSRNKYEYPELGAIGGIKLGVNITHWLAVESGLEYSWVRYRYRSSEYVTDINNPSASYKTYYQNTYHYLDVPVALNFIAGKKRIKGVFSLGADLDFLVRYTHHYEYSYMDGSILSGTETTNTYNLRKFDISPFLGIGVDCYLTKSIDLRIMPIGQIQALKNLNSPVSEYLWNAGVNVSLLFGVIKIR